jgi:hypothetical protein
MPPIPFAWILTEKPDAYETVLLRIEDSEVPIALGYYTGDIWCFANAEEIPSKVTGWACLERTIRAPEAEETVKTKEVPAVAPAVDCSDPDWKEIAGAMFRDVYFALQNLKAPGSGTIFSRTTGEMIHWRTRFADTLEKMPGVSVDREAMFALDLPKAKKVKFFKDREKAEKAEAQKVTTQTPT